MATRNVIVASASSNKAKTFSTCASTWGELKPVIAELLTGNVEAILNPGNTTLRLDSATLPDGDFKIFLIPTKNKAGLTNEEATTLGKEIAEAILKANSIATNEKVEELKSDIIDSIANFFDVDSEAITPSSTNNAAEAQALAEAKALLS